MVQNRFIIFGGTGDLTYRKLLPAFYNLFVSKKLTKQDEILIIGRRDWTKTDYIRKMEPWVKGFARFKVEEDKFLEFIQQIQYLKMNLSALDDYAILKDYVSKSEAQVHVCYMAISPQFFDPIVEGIHQINLFNVRLVMEKPFGTDLLSATKLQRKVTRYFDEENIYRIDHYLGKDMVRNILTIRCENPIFDAVWNNRYIDHVNIFALEQVGVENRGSYYDKAGALRDMAQNHLLQLLSIVAVDNPHDLHTLSLQQSVVLHSLKLLEDSMIMGQYRGYLDEKDIDPKSQTETFARFSVGVETSRFQGVPFHIITGKEMMYRDTAIQIVFKSPYSGQKPNVLTIQVQPKEGVEISFNIKTPGKSDEISEATMDFCQNCQMQNRINTPEAYEWMLMSIMQEDGSWFSHWDQIVTSWKFMDELIRKKPKSILYEKNSLGPEGGLTSEIVECIEKPFICKI